MPAFATLPLSAAPVVAAPDGSTVRVLLALPGGSLAQFELAPGQTARAVTHRTVDELWHVILGRGELWRRQGDRAEIVALHPGDSVSIPQGTHFQFRNTGRGPLTIVAVTLPPWPGADEALFVEGAWPPSV